MTWASTSVTFPRTPIEPSSVVIVAVRPPRRAVSAPNTRSALAAPIRKSIVQPRPRSRSASGNSGALPYPPPTSRQLIGSRGTGNGRPSGPARSSRSRARRSASQRVPGPSAAKTNSTVPPWSGRTSWIENARRSSMDVAGPPTATPTNWPGLNRAAMPGATIVIAWYASTRRTVSTVPLTCSGPVSRSVSLAVLAARSLDMGRVLLQRSHAHLVPVDGLDALDDRGQPGHRRHAWQAAAHGRGPDLVAINTRARLAGAAERRVDNEVDLTGQDGIHDRRLAARATAVAVLTHDRGMHSVAAQNLAGSAGGPDLESQVSKTLHREDHRALVLARYRDECAPLDRQRTIGRRLRLAVGRAEQLVESHDLAGRAHLGAEEGVDARAALV